MAKIAIPEERAYVDERLRPVLARLAKDRALREEFVHFAIARGSHLDQMVQRLKLARWESREPQWVHFFVLVLCEFGLTHKLITLTWRRRTARLPAGKKKDRRKGRGGPTSRRRV